MAGCGPAAKPAPRPLLLYCTPSVEAHGKVLKGVLERGGGRQVLVAPMTGDDIVAALQGLKAGDLAVVAGSGVCTRLHEGGLVRGEPVVYPLTPCAVAAKPLELADLGRPGMRLGGCAKGGDRAAAVERALPAELRPLVEANTVQRGERGEELVRLVRLGALDAAFVWDTPPPAAGLHLVRLPPDPAPCPLLVIALRCSRLSAEDSAALLTELRGEPVARALQGECSAKEATSP